MLCVETTPNPNSYTLKQVIGGVEANSPAPELEEDSSVVKPMLVIYLIELLG